MKLQDKARKLQERIGTLENELSLALEMENSTEEAHGAMEISEELEELYAEYGNLPGWVSVTSR